MTFAAHCRHETHQLQQLLHAVGDRLQPGDVHALRAGSRHIQTILEFTSTSKRGCFQRFRNSLRRVGRRAGAVRDFDVLIDRLASLAEQKDQRPLDALQSRLRHKRTSAVKKLLRVLDEERKPFFAGLARLQTTLTPPISRKSSTAWREKAAAQAVAELKILAGWQELDGTALHQFRIRIRNLRDTLQLDASRYRALLRTLTAMKDALGEWHDWQLLMNLTQRQKWTAAAPFAEEVIRREQEARAAAVRAARDFQQAQRGRLRDSQSPVSTG